MTEVFCSTTESLTSAQILRARAEAKRMRDAVRGMRRLQRETGATLDELERALLDLRRSQ